MNDAWTTWWKSLTPAERALRRMKSQADMHENAARALARIRGELSRDLTTKLERLREATDL